MASKKLCPHIEALVAMLLATKLDVHAKATANDGIKIYCRNSKCEKKFRGQYAGCPQDGTSFLLPPHTDACEDLLKSSPEEACLLCRRDGPAI